MESYGGSCDLAIKSTSQVSERGPVRSFSLECGSKGELTLLFDIFIDDLVVDCMIRALSMASAWGRPM
jgi:hypothetical protein